MSRYYLPYSSIRRPYICWGRSTVLIAWAASPSGCGGGAAHQYAVTVVTDDSHTHVTMLEDYAAAAPEGVPRGTVYIVIR
jgi:hypothetical protein